MSVEAIQPRRAWNRREPAIADAEFVREGGQRRDLARVEAFHDLLAHLDIALCLFDVDVDEAIHWRRVHNVPWLAKQLLFDTDKVVSRVDCGYVARLVAHTDSLRSWV